MQLGRLDDRLAAGLATVPHAVGATIVGILVAGVRLARTAVKRKRDGVLVGVALLAALVATIAMFLPAFAFVTILGPMLGRLRKQAWARDMLAAVGAAAVGLIFAACVALAPSTGSTSRCSS